jgi:hypothetical protein
LAFSELAQLEALAAKHLPSHPPTAENLGRAKWLEQQYWECFEISTANAISNALKG